MSETKNIKKEADLGLNLCQAGNYEEGIKHLLYAAEHNYLDAIVNIGHAYELYGNFEEAFKWTLRGANLGHPIAISNLALLYRRAKGVKCNVEEAVKLGKKLIELGKVAEGYNDIVSSYLYAADEYQRNEEKAFKYALEGSTIIMKEKPELGKECDVVEQLGICYNRGMGTEVNEKESLKCHKYCAECGLGIGYYNAACILGYSDDQDLCNIDECIEYFTKAGEVGYADGFYELGYLYHVGEKVDKDLKIAAYYYASAIRLGNGDTHYEDAIDNLREISNSVADRVLSGKYCSVID